MHRLRILVVVLVALVALVGTASADSLNRNFITHLKGSNEVPPEGVTIDTRAQGQAIFKLSKEGDALEYKLIVANIENVVAAHIHCGTEGVNGPIVAFLYGGPTTGGPVAPGGGRTNGVLFQGTVTADDVIAVPNSNACPGGVADFEDLIEKIQSGGAYVNVHTNDGVDPTNTGAGDFPGGEIRGHIH